MIFKSRLLNLQIQNAALKESLKKTAALDKQGYLKVVDEVGDKATEVVSKLAGEAVKLLGDDKLAAGVTEVVADIGESVSNLVSRYLAVPIHDLILGTEPWDGKNGWHLFHMKQARLDNDLTTLEMPYGIYHHNTPGAPTTNDGCYGRAVDRDIACEAYNVWFRMHGETNWRQGGGH